VFQGVTEVFIDQFVFRCFAIVLRHEYFTTIFNEITCNISDNRNFAPVLFCIIAPELVSYLLMWDR